MIGDVTCRIVRSDGATMILGDGEWRITELENWSHLDYSVNSSEIPVIDGALVTSKRVKSIDRSVTAQYNGSDKEKARADAIAFFNPKYTYEAHMTYMGRTRWCNGEQLGFKASEVNIYDPVTIDWTIFCENPYMLGEDVFGRDISQASGMFGFPWVSFLPESAGSLPGANVGAVVSVREFANSINVPSGGDVPSGIRVTIRPRSTLVNPSLTVGDGWLKLIGSYIPGDTIEVDTIVHPPQVTVNGKSALNKADKKSRITTLVLGSGSTDIIFDADEGAESASVVVYYNKQYLGI